MKKHEREMNKIKEQEIRHNKNIILEQEKFEKKENDNKDKIMKKYITFYWNRKGREEKKKNNFVHFNEKYDERYVRLEEIEKAHEKKQKSLMKKLLTIQTNQKEIYEREKQKYENIQKKRNQYLIMCRNNKKNLDKFFTEETKGVLTYQNFVLSRQKQFEDKKAKLDYLLYSKLNELLPEPEEPKDIPQDMTLTEEDNKKLNTEPTKQENFDIILNDAQNKDNNIDNFNLLDSNKKENNNDENKTDESATEITIDEYLKQLSDAIEAIKAGLKNENIEFKDFVEDKKKEINLEGKKIEYISINDLNNKFKNIGVILSDLKLSCLCSKYSLQSDLRLININSLEEDLNSK